MSFLQIIEHIKSCNDTLFKTKIDEIDTPFKTKPSETHTLSGRTSALRPSNGVPLGEEIKELFLNRSFDFMWKYVHKLQKYLFFEWGKMNNLKRSQRKLKF